MRSQFVAREGALDNPAPRSANVIGAFAGAAIIATDAGSAA
jgi:hypothetical protein